jgi:hypothetical protein
VLIIVLQQEKHQYFSELGIIGALKFENCKFENCHFTVTAAKENK